MAFTSVPLWKRTLANQSDDLDAQREVLRQAFLDSRDRVAKLVSAISEQVKGLTVHDISHLDALWRVADQIAGQDYPLNPAEAYVLGEAFLFHDAAHVVAAYPNGIKGIKETTVWRDIVGQLFSGVEPASGSETERLALFHALRQLHAAQAAQLPSMSWCVPSSSEPLFLIPHAGLREYYGELIGEVAESHHWPAEYVAARLASRTVNAPALLAPANWAVDALKIAFLLRTADAAHVDAERAPWFLFAIQQPTGLSESHWRFQAKMGQPTLTPQGELRLSSGSPFSNSERRAWWLAYDTAKMIDRELDDAKQFLRDHGHPQFAAIGVCGSGSPTAFAKYVGVKGWEPVDVQPTISDVPKVIRTFGGTRLYGDSPDLALRELLQNGADAVRALRVLGGLGLQEGQIEVALDFDGDAFWLHVTDTGVGMSRHVLTRVLPDFGNSLWASETLRYELPGLASTGFRSIGQFGIGFYSVFMLGSQVRVTSKRYKRAEGDDADQWTLAFEDELYGRPILRRPAPYEELPRPGTRISVRMAPEVLGRLVGAHSKGWKIAGLTQLPWSTKDGTTYGLDAVVDGLCPTIDIDIYTRAGNGRPSRRICADDWKSIDDKTLITRAKSELSLSSNKFPTLLPLQEDDGSILGRITYSEGYFASACLTYRGIRTGRLPRLVGVVLGTNNTDLARSSAKPLGSHDAWRRFAEEWIEKFGAKDVSGVINLHPFIPEKDFAVYHLDAALLTLAQLTVLAEQGDELIIHQGKPEHEDYDDVSRSRFESDFQPLTGIVFSPSKDDSIAKAVGVDTIDYLDRLEVALTRAWHVIEKEEIDWYIIGDVSGSEIQRTVYRYTRADSVEDSED